MYAELREDLRACALSLDDARVFAHAVYAGRCARALREGRALPPRRPRPHRPRRAAWRRILEAVNREDDAA